MQQDHSDHKCDKVQTDKYDLGQVGSIHEGDASGDRMKGKIVEVPLFEVFLRYPVILS